VLVDQDITIKENEFRGSEELWELLIHKNVNKEHMISDDLRKYNKILLLTNAHLKGYQAGGVINVGLGKTFLEIIAPFSRGPKAGVSNRGYAVMEKILRWPPGNYITIL